MPPIRRYLRITKFTVLEVRIHLSQPSQTAWLLRGADPALPRVIAAIRPLVLPILREENEKVKGKSAAKKKGVKEVVSHDDFEVSIFFTDTSTRHSLLTKSLVFSAPQKPKALTDWLEPTRGEAATEDEPILIREESPDAPRLDDIPTELESGQNDEKKAPHTMFEGFSIWGRVLCLVIKRTNIDLPGAKTSSSQQMMENWVSTQAAKFDLNSVDLG